jgi:hypothetical protein
VSNQYLKAEEEGRPKPPGANQFTTGKRERHDQATIDKIRAERAAQVAEEVMNDPDSTRQDRLAAAKVLLPYGKSTLQSIEQRQVSDLESMSEEEMKSMVQALITAHPWLLKEFQPGVREPGSAQESVAITQQRAINNT